MNIQTYAAVVENFTNACSRHKPSQLPSFRAHNFLPVVLVDDDDSVLPLITTFEQLSLKDTVYQRYSHLTVSIFTMLQEPLFRKYLSDNGLQMTNITIFSVGYHCFLYQFDKMPAFKRADSLLSQDWVKQDPHMMMS